MALSSSTQVANGSSKAGKNGNGSRSSNPSAKPSNAPPTNQDRLAPLWLAFLFILATALFSLIPRINDSVRLAMSFRAAAGVLLVLLLMLRAQVNRAGRKLSYDFKPRSVHYVQLMMHTCVLAVCQTLNRRLHPVHNQTKN